MKTVIGILALSAFLVASFFILKPEHEFVRPEFQPLAELESSSLTARAINLFIVVAQIEPKQSLFATLEFPYRQRESGDIMFGPFVSYQQAEQACLVLQKNKISQLSIQSYRVADYFFS